MYSAIRSNYVLSLLLMFQMFAFCISGAELVEKPMVVVIPSYNNLRWLKLNLKSILDQEYTNYRIIYVNDCSKDSTGFRVEKFIKCASIDYRVVNFDDTTCKNIPEATDRFYNQVNQEDHFFTLVNNVNRSGALANLYRSIYSCRDDEIIVTLDGDDWFLHPQVLKQLNEIYSQQEVWFTHGALMQYPGAIVSWCEPVPPEIIKRNAFREFKCPSHLRTFYTWLFKKIKLEDLLFEGNFFKMTWDMAIMFPIAEMAGERHAFIAEANYAYNTANQINDNKVNADLQNFLDRYIRDKERYQRLESKGD